MYNAQSTTKKHPSAAAAGGGGHEQPSHLYDATFIRATASKIFVDWADASVELARSRNFVLPESVELAHMWLPTGGFEHECPKQLQRCV